MRQKTELTRSQLMLLRTIRAKAAADANGRELSQVWLRTYRYGTGPISLDPRVGIHRPPGWAPETFKALQLKGLIVRSSNQLRLTLIGEKRR